MMPSEFWGKEEPQNVTHLPLLSPALAKVACGANRSKYLGPRCSLLVPGYASAPRMTLPLGDHQGSSKLISSDCDGINNKVQVSHFTLILQFEPQHGTLES